MKNEPEYDPPTSIRIPLELKAEAAKRAKAESRTLSQQVVYLLRQWVENTPDPSKRKTARR